MVEKLRKLVVAERLFNIEHKFQYSKPIQDGTKTIREEYSKLSKWSDKELEKALFDALLFEGDRRKIGAEIYLREKINKNAKNERY